MEMTKRLNIKLTNHPNLKTSELNNILDKLQIHKDLSSRELEFLENYDSIDDKDLKDFNFLTLSDLFYILMRIEKNVILDIKDREGKINQQIYSADYDYEECKIYLGLKHSKYTITDNFLYKLTYEFKHDNYSLDIENEYYEKIKLDNGN